MTEKMRKLRWESHRRRKGAAGTENGVRREPVRRNMLKFPSEWLG